MWSPGSVLKPRLRCPLRGESRANRVRSSKAPPKAGSVSQRLPTRLCVHLQQPARIPVVRATGSRTRLRSQTLLSREARTGAGRGTLIRTRRPSLLSAGLAEAGRTSALLRAGDSQLPPLFAWLPRSSFLAPRALLAAPPAALSNCLLEAAVKCRERRGRFTVASPRPEPGSAHRRQSCL